MAARLARIGPTPLLLAAALLLALHPALWLIRTWSEPGYNAQGAWVALAVLALALWSYSSEQQPGSEQNRRYAFGLLALSAGVRLIGQLLRVNLVGALTLAVDVYALATLAGLRQRRRAVSPFWLSMLFAFSLPLERVAQRLVGYGLQQLSAGGACELLGWLADGVQCMGTRILLGGQDLLVDLPCSGARGLVLVLTLYAGLCAVKRPSLPQAALGLLLALAGALVANTLRIVALALGLAYVPEVDVMDAVVHETLGVLALVVAVLPLTIWASRAHGHLPSPSGREIEGEGRQLQRAVALAERAPLTPAPLAAGEGRTAKALAWLLLGFSLVAISAPAHPVDVARSVAPPAAPARLDGHAAEPQALAPVERAYFARYGGGATKARYGEHALLLVSTSAPLRHLHAPDECLRGSGHRVQYRGLEHGALPTALYRSTDADGRVWRVAVSYLSDRGDSAASVTEAVWRWLRDPGSTWTMVQRITPWDADERGRQRWEAALMRALDRPAASVHSFHRVADAS